MSDEVSKLGVKFIALLHAECPGVFLGEAEDTAIATMAIAETMGGVFNALALHHNEATVRAVVDRFWNRVKSSAAGIRTKVVAGFN